MSDLAKTTYRTFRLFLVCVSAVSFAVHYVHLAADFPNFSPWMDWSKYTDEGWYGDAAIRHYQLGHWYVPGDFNPAAALPVWPLLEGILFALTGVSLIAARALTVTIFGGILLVIYLLMRRLSPRASGNFAPEFAVLLLATSPFCFVFTRLAILEPLMILITLLLLLVASNIRVEAGPRSWRVALASEIGSNLVRILSMGMLLPLLILTKTTGVFLIPCVAFMLFAAVGYRVGPFFRVGTAMLIVACSVWLLFFVCVVRPHYLLDYRYLFSANGYTGITLATAPAVVADTFKDGAWIGRFLYSSSVCCLVVSVLFYKKWRQVRLIPTLLLWVVGYESFLAYHNNLQPRYYLVVAVPLTLLIPAAIEQLVLPQVSERMVRYGIGLFTASLLGTVAIVQSAQTISYLRHPEYTLLQSARHVQQVIEAHQAEDPKHNPLILSISGSDLSLMTGMPSICDDFGTLELVDRVRKYKPGWYVAWNQIDDDKMDALTPYYHVERVAAFPAMDDPDRNLLIVYRLDDSVETAPTKRHRKPPPRALVTRVGQQPSTTQLEH